VKAITSFSGLKRCTTSPQKSLAKLAHISIAYQCPYPHEREYVPFYAGPVPAVAQEEKIEEDVEQDDEEGDVE
jgi:hypothetical protein